MSGCSGQLKGHDLERRLHANYRHGRLQQSAPAHDPNDEYRDGNVPAGIANLPLSRSAVPVLRTPLAPARTSLRARTVSTAIAERLPSSARSRAPGLRDRLRGAPRRTLPAD
jgi:hypothetical protein